MRRIGLSLFLCLFLSNLSFSQLTGTKNIPGDYANLQAAITALNTSGVGAGGVVFNVVAGNPQTAPVGGYIIGNTGSAILSGIGVTSSTKTVTIQGNANTITAALQTAGTVNDAIFKLVGADWITITGFTIQENSGNTVLTPEASNTMTEWAIALLHVSVTDGAQNNTIQGNTITMNRAYLNSFGIYSNARHSLSAINTVDEVTSTSGSNSNNKVYGNSISNVNYPVFFNGPGVAAYTDDGNDIGGSSVTTGNTLSNCGNAKPQTNFINIPNDNFGIIMFQQGNENVSYNSITTVSVNTTFYVGGICKTSPAVTPAGTFTSSYTHNTITATQASATGSLFAINFGTSTASSTTNITDNTILNCSMTDAGATGNFAGIINTATTATLNITGNTIKGCSLVKGFNFYGILNGAPIVNTININNNQLGVAGSGLVSFSVATISISAIQNANSGSGATININNNKIDGISCVSSTAVTIIYNAGGGIAINIKDNQLGSVTGTLMTCSAAQSPVLTAIQNSGTLSTGAIDISNNDIRGFLTPVSSSTQYFIRNTVVGASQTINNNTFTNIVSRSTGFIYFIRQGGNMVSGASYACNNNRIVGTYNKTLSGGQVFFMYADGSAVSGSTVTETGNNFSNVYLVGSPPLFGWCEQQGVSVTNGPTKTITGNTFSNITLEGGLAAVMYMWKGTNINCSNNTVSNITAPAIFGISVEAISTAGTYTISGNTISDLETTGASTATAIIGGTQLTSITANNNIISNIRTTSATGTDAAGIDISGTSAIFSGNTISDISSAGTGVSSGIILRGGGTALITNNKIHTLTNIASGTATSPRVHGLQLQAGTSVTATNNFIANLTAPSLGGTDVIRGISILSKVASTSYNLYYNSVYLNAASAAANFGTSAVFDSTSANPTTAALEMIDNIFVNTSTPKGTGKTVAFRRSDATLSNYTLPSNYNLYYSGTPAATNLIFDDGTNSDQTITAFKTRVNVRETNSISAMPDFTSGTDLHLSGGLNCDIEGTGIPISGFATDIDGATRNATTPDIGADEFNGATAVTTLAGTVSSTICNSRDIDGATTFKTNTCNLIATVQSAGASPVNGSVNACVYIDPTVLPTYNAEPYVQRHFDIVPAENASTSTARITLYFTDAEFVTYNANNAAWPDLPTVAGGGNSDPKRSNLRVSQYHGTANTSPSSPNQYSTGTAVLIDPADADIVWNGNYWAVSFDVTGFSGFYVHSNLKWVLPIEVNYFKGSKQGNNHLLNWKLTCNSTPTVTITLERSNNVAGGFIPVYGINATAARCNQPFDYTDAQPLPGMNYYRVKMVDANGKVTYSSIVALLNAIKGFDIISIAPNPVVSGNLKLNMTAVQAAKMEVMVIDMQGRVVKREQVSLGSGFSSVNMDVSGLSPGSYSLYGITADGRSSVLRFVKQ